MGRGRDIGEEDRQKNSRFKNSINNEVVLAELEYCKMKSRREILRLRYWWKLINMDRGY
eukprot:TRINITY_DN8087_c0_g1_i1.p1 TRINITY_DN8087_c0_g1~~TRINITY_DN8087_c0_g1_i1.p1  ORF type:complete len:59 (+),score=6.42 TRINITY_DN8087_c0_g1_i1:148-324(+)